MTSIDKVLAKWRADGLELLPPNDLARVTTVFDSLGHGLSRDVADLYHATGGMTDGQMDALCFNFWSLERMVVENRKHPNAGILFADFLIDSHGYLFRYDGAEASSVHIEYWDGKGPHRLASSVSEFFDLYLDNPDTIGLFGL
jgi:hypothetical protein